MMTFIGLPLSPVGCEGSGPAERKARDAHGAPAVPRRLAVEPVVGDPSMPLVEGDPHLEAGEVRTEAAVWTRAKRAVAVVPPPEVDARRVVERRGIATRHGQRQDDAIARLELDPGELGVLAHDPEQ